jgi:hypothetical protein
MKRLSISALIFFALFSCKNDDTIGISIQPPQDAIKVVVDTFWVGTQDFYVDSISAQVTDSLSMLLGEYYSPKYGSVKANLLVQIAPPVNYNFPDASYNPQPDSLVLLLAYHTWCGSRTEPFEISIYQLNKGMPDYYEQYFTNFDESQFLDINDNQLLGRKIATSIDQSLADSVVNSGSYLPSIRYRFNNETAQQFFEMSKNQFPNIQSFLDEFKGIYITTTFGQSTMLYLYGIELRLFYHYTYQKNGQDTIVNTYITYPANKEVRQLNKITHTGLQSVLNQRDSVNYITSAAGAYPKINIPIGKIRKNIADSIGNKSLNFNSINLSVEATEIDSSENAMPVPANMLIIRTADFGNLLSTNMIKSIGDSVATLAYYYSDKKEYTFDIARIVSRIVKSNLQDFDASEEFMLLPVDVFYNSAGTISEIRPQKRIGALTFRSGKNSYSPMRLEVVYSGF